MFNGGVFTTGTSAILFGLLDHAPGHTSFISLAFIIRIIEALGNAAFLTASFTIIAAEFPNSVASSFAALETFFGVGLIAGPMVSQSRLILITFVTKKRKKIIHLGHDVRCILRVKCRISLLTPCYHLLINNSLNYFHSFRHVLSFIISFHLHFRLEACFIQLVATSCLSLCLDRFCSAAPLLRCFSCLHFRQRVNPIQRHRCCKF